MTVVLALLSSALWGIADFLGGQGARKLPTLVVLAWVQLAGVTFAAIVFVVFGPDASAEGLLWGAAAGVVGAAAIGTFYAALAAGAMSLVAPLAACGAVIPAVVAIAGGESPSALVLVGFALALGGGALVAREPRKGPGSSAPLDRHALTLAIGSAVLIGLLLTLIQHASEVEGSSAVTAVVAARAASLALVLAVVMRRRERIALGGADLRPLLVAGVFDTSANALFAIATTEGSDAVAAVLGSLYPVMTVVLAGIVLHERVARSQAAGIAVALAGVLLVSAG